MRYRGDPARMGAVEAGSPPGGLAVAGGSSPFAPRLGIAAHPPVVSRTTAPDVASRSTITTSATIKHRGSATRVTKNASCGPQSSVPTGIAPGPSPAAGGSRIARGALEHVRP